MKGISRWIPACFAAVLALALAGAAAEAETVKVGIVLPLTGEQAKFGEIEKRSFEMAAEEINAKGGVKGRKLELLFEDDTGKPDVGRSAVEKLISQSKVPVLTGGYSSSVTAAVTAVAQQFKVPFLVTTGSADEVTEKRYDYIFRINPTASEYPASVVTFLQEVAKPKTAVILYENSLFGQSSSKSFEKDCDKLGIKVLTKEGYNKGAVDFKPLLTKVKAMNPDLVYMVSYVMDAALLIRQAKELDLNPKLFIGGAAGFTLPEFRKNAGDATEFVYSATLWVDSVPYAGALEYSKKFLAKYKEATEYHGAEAYASMYVVADALRRAKSITPKDVRDALATTDMMTAFGPVKFISYEKKTQQNKLPTYMVQWQNGKLETVWPKEVAKKKYVFPVPNWNERKKK
ncbi:MAG: ABC transporter substrate-binding protein [Deltaproteobacteria bacterium]|nr:ABC transporter substrate-binding protein [Deltaproteobacteria bacterium]PWB67157.1 MAG: ABC transporter substrate-binding protein [Deltaproteobacteria bacterium]